MARTSGSREEKRPGGEVESFDQSQVRSKRPHDRYGKWIVYNVHRIINRLQSLEDKQRVNKDPIRKLKENFAKERQSLKRKL